MKQKFTIVKDEANKKLVIKEYAELDKDILSLLCEETYEADAIVDAIGVDKEALFAALRTKNMYPPKAYMEQICESVIALYETEGPLSKDLLLNDIDLLLPPEAEESEEIEEELEDDGGIDDLLDDDEVDDELEKKLDLTKIKSSLKIADDESDDGEDD